MPWERETEESGKVCGARLSRFISENIQIVKLCGARKKKHKIGYEICSENDVMEFEFILFAASILQTSPFYVAFTAFPLDSNLLLPHNLQQCEFKLEGK